MFVLSVLEAPNTKTNSLCVQTHLAIKLFLILILLFLNPEKKMNHKKILIKNNFFNNIVSGAANSHFRMISEGLLKNQLCHYRNKITFFYFNIYLNVFKLSYINSNNISSFFNRIITALVSIRDLLKIKSYRPQTFEL